VAAHAVGALVPGATCSDPARARGRPAAADLTRRELDILRLGAGGASTRAMAERPHVSPATVRNHVQHVLESSASTAGSRRPRTRPAAGSSDARAPGGGLRVDAQASGETVGAGRRRRRARPVRPAASATPPATASTTRRSNTDGMT
jgi:DNA-binding CsgD family transcriptional regulator